MKRIDNPLFIIGNPRSGTTMLRLMLMSHSKVMIPPECGWAFWLYDKYKDQECGVSNYIIDMTRCKKMELWNIDRNKLFRYLLESNPKNYADLINDIYIFYGRDKKDFTIWGDKNNFYIDYIDQIKEVFPKARFIHLVRDGRDVACSYREINKKEITSKYAPNLPDNIEEIANEWKDNVNKAEKADGITLRYEQIAQAPAYHLKQICNYLEIYYEPEMLDFHKTDSGEPEEFLQWKYRNKYPLSPNIGRHKVELSEYDLSVFNKIAGKELKRYGYTE